MKKLIFILASVFLFSNLIFANESLRPLLPLPPDGDSPAPITDIRPPATATATAAIEAVMERMNRTSYDDLINQYEEAHNRVLRLINQYREYGGLTLQNELTGKKTELARTVADLIDAKTQISALNKRNDQLNKLLRSINVTIAGLELQKIGASEKKLENLKNQLSRLYQQRQVYVDEQNANSGKSLALNSKIKTLEANQKTLQAEIANLNKQITLIDMNYKNYMQQFQNIENELKRGLPTLSPQRAVALQGLIVKLEKIYSTIRKDFTPQANPMLRQ